MIPAALKRKIKWIGVWLVCFMLGMFCACACAEEVTIVASGYCGDEWVDGGRNLTYQLDSNGKLTISGQGTMGYEPFQEYSNKIITVEIEDGVTSIGNSAFYDCSSLASINIPDGVTRIDYSAFSGCSSLASINIPDSVVEIGPRSFSDCSGLTSIVIPNGVTKIGYFAFLDCIGLRSISIPESMIEIEHYAFWNCSNLTSISLPDGIAEVGSDAFHGCTALKHVILPFDFTADYGFGNRKTTVIYCYEDSATDIWATEEGYQVVYLDDLDLTKPLEVTLMASQTALLSNENVTLIPIVFPEQANQPVQWSSSAPDIISVENGVVTVLADGAATITATCGGMSDSVDLWGSAALDSFRTNAGGKLTTISKNTFSGNDFQTILLPEGCTAIASKAFENNTSLKAVYIPESVTVIANDAFDGCGDFVVIGQKDSKAEAYAQKNDLAFYTRLKR